MLTVERLRSKCGVDHTGRPNSAPNEWAVRTLSESGLLVIFNRIVGSGKGTLFNALTTGDNARYCKVPSLMTRDYREGEIPGVDRIRVTHTDMLAAVDSGLVVEVFENNPGSFYATGAQQLHDCEAAAGLHPIKDIDTRGYLALLGLNPDVRGACPIPSMPTMPSAENRLTPWEERWIGRDGNGADLSSVLDIDHVNKGANAQHRLQGALEDIGLIRAAGLPSRPNIFLVENHSPEQMKGHVLAWLSNPGMDQLVGLQRRALYMMGLLEKRINTILEPVEE